MDKNKNKIMVTGATGFVGGALVNRLVSEGKSSIVVAAVRSKDVRSLKEVQTVQVGDLLYTTDWTAALQDVMTVVHCAARVHMIKEKISDPLEDFRRVNVYSTISLARQAAFAGVRRFIFLSSIKVNGEFTENGQSFYADSVTAPLDPYGISKCEAEQLLRQISSETGMEVVIIRSPLVYGRGVKGNFASMMHWVSKGVPLPLAAITGNCRSLVGLDNLIDLIWTCLNHSAAANQTFLVSDSESLSTVELLSRLGFALGRPIRLFYLPTRILKLGSMAAKREGIYQKLCMSLKIDIKKNTEILGWTPPVSINDGLLRAVENFRE